MHDCISSNSVGLRTLMCILAPLTRKEICYNLFLPLIDRIQSVQSSGLVAKLHYLHVVIIVQLNVTPITLTISNNSRAGYGESIVGFSNLQNMCAYKSLKSMPKHLYTATCMYGFFRLFFSREP